MLHVAKRYGVPETNLRRHKNHDPELVADSKKARANTIFEQLEFLSKEAKRLLGVAEKQDDIKASISALREMTRLTEIAAKAAGELQDNPIVLNVFNLDEATGRRIAEAYLERVRRKEQREQNVHVIGK